MLKKFSNKSEYNFYTVLMTVVFSIVIVTNLFQTVYTVRRYEEQVTENYYKYAGNSLDRFKSEIDNVIGKARAVAVSLAANNEISNKVRAGTVQSDTERIENVKNSLFAIPEIVDVVFFNPDMDRVYSIQSSTYLLYDEYWEGMTNEEIKLLDKQRVVKRTEQRRDDVDEVLTVCYATNAFYDSYILIDIDFDEIKREIRRYALKEECELSVEGEDEVWFATNKELFSKIEDSAKVASVAGEKYGMFLVESESFGMKYTALKKYDIIKNNYIMKSQIRFVIIYLAIFVLGLGALYFSMKLSYKPIRKVMKDYVRVNKKSEKENDEKKLREFIMYPMVNEKTAEQAEVYAKTRLNQIKNVCLVAVYIDGYENFTSAYTTAEQEAYRYAVENVFCEIVSEYFKCITVESKGNNIFFLISKQKEYEYDFEYEREYERIRSLFVTSAESIKKHLDICLSAVIAGNCGFDELNNAYEEINLLKNYRLVFPQGSIITKGENIDEDGYIVKKYEKEIVEKAEKGEPVELSEEYINALRYSAPGDVIVSIINLMSKLYDVISQKWNIRNISCSELIKEILNAETLEDIQKIFGRLFNEAERTKEEFPKDKYNTIVQNVYREIDANWTDPYFCADTIAEKLKYSTIHLGRAFKFVTGRSVSGEIMKRRLDESEKILREQDVPIKEIFEKCGFASNSYFSVLFKKQFGISPSEYRRSIAENKN